MTIPEAQNKLKKYWNGESTLDEEEQLKQFFHAHSRDSLPLNLRQAADLFSFYEAESERTTGKIALTDVTPNKADKTTLWKSSYWKYAAVVVLVAGAAFFFRTASQPLMVNHGTNQIQRTPKQAFKTTKRALKLVASNLNEGREEIQQIAIFSEVQHMVAGN